jgi:hypothetical protein
MGGELGAWTIPVLELYDEVSPEQLDLLPGLYKSYFSTAEHFQVGTKLKRLGAISLSDGEALRHLLIFERNEKDLRILNEIIEIAPDEIKLICARLFSHYTAIDCIKFSCIPHPARSLSDCALDVYVSSNGIIDLSGGFERYFASISSSTRRNFKRNEKAFLSEHADARFKILIKEECAVATVSEIYMFLNCRLKVKRIGDLIDASYVDAIFNSCQKYGHIGVYEVGERIVAGVIFCQICENVFFLTVGHDQTYDRYYLGQLCLLRTIEEAVRRGGKMLHVGWGGQEYKRRLRAHMYSLYIVNIYRNRSAMWLSPLVWPLLARVWARTILGALKHRLASPGSPRERFLGLFRPRVQRRRVDASETDSVGTTGEKSRDRK